MLVDGDIKARRVSLASAAPVGQRIVGPEDSYIVPSLRRWRMGTLKTFEKSKAGDTLG